MLIRVKMVNMDQPFSVKCKLLLVFQTIGNRS